MSLAIHGIAFPILASEPSREVRISARALNVRSADGEVLCKLDKDAIVQAIGRHEDDERIQIKMNTPNCPKEGFVYISGVRPTSKDGIEKALVDMDGLSLRTNPEHSNQSWKCSLPKNTALKVIDGKSVFTGDASFVKVEVNDANCKGVGYVAEAYLKPADKFTDLPIVKTGESNSSIPDCKDCNKKSDRNVKFVKDLEKGLSAAEKQQKRPDEKGSFLTEVAKMRKNSKYKPAGHPSNRGLVQIPILGKKGKVGPCGSLHYNPDDPIGVDAYANPLTACVMMSVLQEWKKNSCPDSKGCSIQWGDISHRSKPVYNGHKTHTDGYCIDFRPMRKGSFEDAPLTYKDSNYDRAKMREFVSLVRKKGAAPIYFNDTTLGTTAISGHHNHIHVCFHSNPKTKAACDNFKVDLKTCPELQ